MKVDMKQLFIYLVIITSVFIFQQKDLFASRKKTTFNQDVQNAKLVFVGQVISTDTVSMDRKYLTKIPRRDWTKVNFSISELLKDENRIIKNNQNTIELFFMKGTDNIPEFTVREHIVALLYTGTPLEDMPSFITASGNKYELENMGKKGAKSVVKSRFGRRVKRIDNEMLTYGEKNDTMMSVDEFVSEIKKRLIKRK